MELIGGKINFQQHERVFLSGRRSLPSKVDANERSDGNPSRPPKETGHHEFMNGTTVFLSL